MSGAPTVPPPRGRYFEDFTVGDVLLTGTPAGVGAPKQTFLKVGDRVEAEIEGIGRLDVTVQESR